MPSPFSRTTRSLNSDRARFATPILAFCLLLLLAWGGWLAFATVPVFQVTDAARLEVVDAVHPVAAAVGGRVVRTRLTIGRTVEKGEVLVELDSDAERLAAAEAQARLVDLGARRMAVEAEIRAHRRALDAHAGALGTSSDEAQAQVREAEARARLAESEAERARQLVATGAATSMEWERARAEADARRAQADALRLTASRLAQDRGVQASDRRARLAELDRQVVELAGEAEVEAARIERLGHQAERFRIRAPVSGQVGEVAAVEPGSVVDAGARLGSIVPSSDLRVVAFFPATALGRIRAGQPARVRLSGFAWTEFGRLDAEVSEVASEARSGQIRAELRLRAPYPRLVPLEHGLPGSAEVEVERVSPITLVLRAAGRSRAAEPLAVGRVAAEAAP